MNRRLTESDQWAIDKLRTLADEIERGDKQIVELAFENEEELVRGLVHARGTITWMVLL